MGLDTLVRAHSDVPATTPARKEGLPFTDLAILGPAFFAMQSVPIDGWSHTAVCSYLERREDRV